MTGAANSPAEVIADAVLDAASDAALARLAARLGGAGLRQPPDDQRPRDDDDDGWLSTAAAARYLGISTSALHKEIAARTIDFAQRGRGCSCWFKRAALDAYRRGDAP